VGPLHIQQKVERLSHRISCCIIGDVNIDYITDLSHLVIKGDTNACIYNPITSSVGGNSVFFAEAACEAEFHHVIVLCSIGNDIGGLRAREYLQKLGASVHVLPSDRQTGQVIILYQPDDRRIMVADRGANRDFRIPEPGMLPELIETSQLLYVSGYMLLNPDQCAAVHTISKTFRTARAKILVDMVPHDVWQTRTWRKYVDMCSFADCVAVEMGTISAFHRESPNPLAPEDAVRLLLKDFELCLIRINDASDFIIADRTRQRLFRVPYRRTVASLRFTDRVIACVMRQYIEDPQLLFESNLWLDRAKQAVSGGR
jgi:sugar/nucleoside kinase (ribokinase family)